MPKPLRLNVRVPHILLSSRLNTAQVITALYAVAPKLNNLPFIDTFDDSAFEGGLGYRLGANAFRFKGGEAWDREWKHKSLCVLDAGDRPFIGWETEALLLHRRALLIAECPHPHSDVRFTLLDRRLRRFNRQGADTAVYKARTAEFIPFRIAHLLWVPHPNRQ